MKILIEWLEDFTTIDKSQLQQLAEKMTTAGLEVDAIEKDHFEVSFTPDLGYARSHLGSAYFIASLTGEEVRVPTISSSIDVDKEVKIGIDQEALPFCPYYSVRYLEQIHNGPSPTFIQERLKSVGIKPQNLIVDVTNYTLIALGSPLHAFDLDKIEHSLQVSLAKQQDPFIGLDNKECSLKQGDLVIKSEGRVEALAGILGGKLSAIDENSSKIALEAALFDATLVRRSGKYHKILTQSFQRFENKIDPNLPPLALSFATDLLVKYGGAKVGKTSILSTGPFLPKKISLRVERVSKLIGLSFDKETLNALFKKADIHFVEELNNSIIYQVPTYRTDLLEEVDLIEEVVRLYGLDQIDIVPLKVTLSSHPESKDFAFQKEVRKGLLSLGLQEIMTSSLVDRKIEKDSSSLIAVLSSLSDRSVMRTSLLPGAIEALLNNQKYNQPSLFAFEMGKSYFCDQEGFIEIPLISMIESGENASFFSLKGALDALLRSLHIDSIQYVPSSDPLFHPHCQAGLHVKEDRVGIIGQLHPLVMSQQGIKGEAFFVEIDAALLQKHAKTEFFISPISFFPSIERDFTFKVGKKVSFAFIQASIELDRHEYLEDYKLISTYAKENEPLDHYVTIRFIFRSLKNSLKAEEIDSIFEHIKQRIEKEIIPN